LVPCHFILKCISGYSLHKKGHPLQGMALLL
jgi:hypothetical protein